MQPLLSFGVVSDAGRFVGVVIAATEVTPCNATPTKSSRKELLFNQLAQRCRPSDVTKLTVEVASMPHAFWSFVNALWVVTDVLAKCFEPSSLPERLTPLRRKLFVVL